MFLDFDKKSNVFYDNLYLSDYKLVVKTPITEKRTASPERVRIEEFILTNYVYLTTI